MRSTYKKLGPYIRELKVRNKNEACADLRGVSIGKEFMPSVANVHGTDLSKYKRVEKHQFAFNPMHVGRDEVLPVALLAEDEPVIVSPAYVVFEVRDAEVLHPEYLMMWCRRPEFDRNAWFTTDNSVRGGFSWDNFCDMELPVPSIEKQREIVKEYRTVVDRIRLNERLNEKFEEVAQAIYKQWFVEFEFPMTAEYAESIGKPELASQPYKSSGGEMEYNEVLEQEIPKGWVTSSIGEYATVKSGYAFKSAWWRPIGIPVIKIGSLQGGTIDSSRLDFVEPGKLSMAQPCIVSEGGIVIAMTGATMGKVALVPALYELFLVNQRVGLFDLGENPLARAPYLFITLKQDYVQREIESVGGDSAQANISPEQIQDIPILNAGGSLDVTFNSQVQVIFKLMSRKQFESSRLKDLAGILLSRLVRANGAAAA